LLCRKTKYTTKTSEEGITGIENRKLKMQIDIEKSTTKLRGVG